jgi:Domain of unknown function (DUF397)
MTTADCLAWRISSRSGNGENGVEVTPAADGVVIRHSKHPHDYPPSNGNQQAPPATGRGCCPRRAQPPGARADQRGDRGSLHT